MKVLWLGHNLAFPPKGGALQRNYNLIREISRKCEVHVLAFDQPITRPTHVTPHDCARALLAFCASVDWVEMSSSAPGRSRYGLALRGFVGGEPYDFAWLRSSQMAEKLKRKMGSLSFDVVHVDTLGLAQYLPLLGKVGALLNHHDVESRKIEVRASNARNPLMRAYFSLEAAKLLTAERKWCPQFGVNAVVSDEEGEILRSTSPGVKVRVVPNGVDTNFFTCRPDPGRPTLLFCGSLDMHPNQEAMAYFLKRLWPRLLVQVPDIELYIVGRNPPRWLEEAGRNNPRVHVTGYVDDVRPYFQHAAVCVSDCERRGNATQDPRQPRNGGPGGFDALCRLRTFVRARATPASRRHRRAVHGCNPTPPAISLAPSRIGKGGRRPCGSFVLLDGRRADSFGCV